MSKAKKRAATGYMAQAFSKVKTEEQLWLSTIVYKLYQIVSFPAIPILHDVRIMGGEPEEIILSQSITDRRLWVETDETERDVRF